MNDIEKIGVFIQQLRKEQNMTQKELALQLGITDKAVSKWERGLSCPDISLLIPLAKILGVTTSELLSGARTEEPSREHVENVVEEALEYSGKSRRFKFEKVRKILMLILTASLLLAAGICLICDYAVTKGITWSAIVIISLLFAWLLLMPFVQEKKKRLRKSMIILSLAIVPYLAALSWVLNIPMIVQLGAGISIISLVGIWCIYAIFLKLRHRKLCAAGITFLLVIPLTWAINHMISFLLGGQAVNIANDMINIILSVFLALVCFGLDYIVRNRAGEQQEF